MKLAKIHIFLLLLFSLIFCCVGFSTFEGLTHKITSETSEDGNRIDGPLAGGGKYDPYNNQNDSGVKAGSVPPLKPISKDEIPDGDNDLYILKSQIVPPVCPKCPDVKSCPTKAPCPPCPAPERCPEKPYECKMVPKYTSKAIKSHLPRPMLNSFDQFSK